jgi:hypothetical protein
MSRRIDLLAGAVILAGAGILGRPAAAHATYLNVWDRPDSGVLYCCETRPTAKCCSNSGCMTRDGLCLVVR